MKCCELFAGKLRTKITIERETSTPDSQGGQSLAWSTHATIKAYLKPMSGGERLQAMRLEANQTHRIYIRYRDDLLTTDRIVIGNRKFQIRALINIEERNKWIEIYADEGETT